VFGIFLLFSLNILAQPQPTQLPGCHEENSHVQPLGATHELTESDLTILLDILVPLQLKRDNLAGVTISIVKDGKVLFAKGYGYADMRGKEPVSAGDTLFHVGSISKLFTWTAVMQLVEQGKLELDRDVNDYLDFKIPATYPQPITLRTLMTHTPGFEDTYKDVFVSTAPQFQPLGTYLRTHLPRRIFPPGRIPAYSNYGAALAGYIVERISGRAFEDYVWDSIFKPLAMTHSTFVQPLPIPMQAQLAQGYGIASAEALPVELVQTGPAGGLSTSATDIAHFMIAQLQDGQFGDTRILRSETARLMHARQFSVAETTNGMALGFYEESRNNHRIIGHSGDLNGFHSNLHLILDAGVGFFVSYNSAGQPDYIARKEIWQTFLDRYFPYTPQAMPSLASANNDGKTVSGVYFSSRRSNDSIMKPVMMTEEITVAATPEGTIKIDSEKDFNGQPKRWQEVGELLYREINGQDRVQFRRDVSGRLVLVPDTPIFVFKKASIAENKWVNCAVVAAVFTVFLVAVLVWPIAAFLRRHYRRTLTLSPTEARLRIMARLIGLLDVAVIAVWLKVIQVDPVLTAKWDPLLHLIQVCAVVGVIGSIVVIYHAYRTWMNAATWAVATAFEGMVAMASVGYIWLVVNWNILSVGLRF